MSSYTCIIHVQYKEIRNGHVMAVLFYEERNCYQGYQGSLLQGLENFLEPFSLNFILCDS